MKATKNYKKIKPKILLLGLLFASSIIFAQTPSIIQQEWVNTYSYQDSIYNTATAIDANGFIYVTGYTYDAVTKANITTIKYDVAGNEIWVRHYNGASNGNDRATGIVYDNNGNIYVCGFTTSGINNQNYILIKYNSYGNQLWTRTYDNGGYDCINDIATDNYNNVYVTGESQNAGHNDIVTVKLDPYGNALWLKRKDNGNNDFAKSIVVKNNNVYVGGYGMFSSYNHFLVSYNLYGNEQYSTTAVTGSNDIAEAMTVDNNSYVYITGYTDSAGVSEYYTVKFDANGNVLGNRNYKSDADWNRATSICNDNAGNVYVTGISVNTNINTITTLKYNTLGENVWTQKHYTQAQMHKATARIVCDNITGVYVGTTAGTSSNNDYCTIKYDFNGAEKWIQTFNGTANGNDIVSDLTVDSQNNVYVTGQSYNGNNFDFATVKYSLQDIYIPKDYLLDPASDNYIFYKNKGQLKDIQNNPRPDLKFYTNACSPKIYLSDTSLSYVFAKIDTIEATEDTLYRVDMNMHRGNYTKLQYMEPVNGHLNYYLAHIPEGRTNVNGYRRIVAPNIYDKIDLQYYSNSAGFKKYFVVNPGGDYENIRMEFNGASNLSLSSGGNLKIETPLGTVEFEHAAVYRVDSYGNITPMPYQGDYVINQNHVSFDIQNYPSNNTLVIMVTQGLLMPTGITEIGNLMWNTYYGGDGMDAIVSSTVDENRDLFITGWTNSSDFPVYVGEYMNPFGQSDMFLASFDSVYNWRYSTYFGGNNDDSGNDIIHNNGFVFLAGMTLSDDIQHLPYSGFYFDDTLGGPQDAVIAMFDKDDGYRQWSTYFGGDSFDVGTGIELINDDILFYGYTSSNNLPIVNMAGAYNDASNNGDYDLFLSRFNGGNLIWSTYYGGSAFESSSDIMLKNNKIYLTGRTQSNNFPVYNPNLADTAIYFQNFNNEVDALLISFKVEGELLYSSCIGGTGKDTPGSYNDLYVDSMSNIYIVGSTESYDFPKRDFGGFSYYKPNLTGNTDGFIFNLDSNFYLNWSTYYGKYDDDKIYAVTGNNNSVFITGITNSDYGITDYFLGFYYDNTLATSPNYSYDAFLTVFDNNKILYWSSYFGGGDTLYYGDERGHDIKIKGNYLYLSGITSSRNIGYGDDFDLIDPGNGAYFEDLYGGGYWDGFISAFNIENIDIGIQDIQIDNNTMHVYPNPTNNNIYVSTEYYKCKYIVTDAMGKIVLSGLITNNGINLKTLSNGIYIIQVQTNNTILSSKIIKY